MKDSWSKHFDLLVAYYGRFSKEEEKVSMWRELNKIQRKINRAQSKHAEECYKFYQFVKGKYWTETQKNQILKAREERRMATEIRINVEVGDFRCAFPGEVNHGSYKVCYGPARAWRTECGEAIMIACKKHGQPVLQALSNIKAMWTDNSLTITGGYDAPKPVSNLDKLRNIVNGPDNKAVHGILNFLIDKEAKSDSP